MSEDKKEVNLLDKLAENIHFILTEDDSDEIKLEKIFKKMRENSLSIKATNIEVNNHSENFVLGTITFKFHEDEIKIPFVVETLKYNSEIHNIITVFKKVLIFERFGILPTTRIKVQDIYNNIGNATDKQKALLKDKLQYQDSKEIIENKLKEFCLTSVDEISKEQASKIIDLLPKRRGG